MERDKSWYENYNWCRDFSSFLDFIMCVVGWSPDNYPQEDVRDFGMNLDYVYKQLHNAVDILEDIMDAPEKITEARRFLKESYEGYLSNEEERMQDSVADLFELQSFLRSWKGARSKYDREMKRRAKAKEVD